MSTSLRSRLSHPDEEGFSLVDILLAVSLMMVVLIITTPVVTAFYDVNQNVQQTYNSANQVILASEKLTQYIHEAVAPCPTGTTQSNCPTSAFTTATGNSLTFYANTNNSTGPSEVVVSISGTTLTAVDYQATGSCPFNGSYSSTCAFSPISRRVAYVTGLSNTSPFYYLTSTAGGCSSSGGEVQTPTVSAVVGVCMTLQTAATQKGQSTAYQSLAFALAPSYNGSVG
jgi:hypothetical protein